jgi:hypothetical protein
MHAADTTGYGTPHAVTTPVLHSVGCCMLSVHMQLGWQNMCVCLHTQAKPVIASRTQLRCTTPSCRCHRHSQHHQATCSRATTALELPPRACHAIVHLLCAACNTHNPPVCIGVDGRLPDRCHPLPPCCGLQVLLTQSAPPAQPGGPRRVTLSQPPAPPRALHRGLCRWSAQHLPRARAALRLRDAARGSPVALAVAAASPAHPPPACAQAPAPPALAAAVAAVVAAAAAVAGTEAPTGVCYCHLGTSHCCWGNL